jgi:hypothetical protein
MNQETARRRLGGWIDRPTARQLELLAALGSVYERHGVLAGERPRALADCCPDAAACWRGALERISRDATLEGDGEDGSIFWPYIGREYRPGGVCLLGWNINHDGSEWYGLQEEFVIADHDAARLAAGHTASEWRSMFAYRSLSAGLAVADALAGADPVAEPEPQRLAEGMQRLARLQTVKCVPLGNRGNPEPAMNARCPRRYLVEELEILRPSTLVVFGDQALNSAVDAIERHSGAWFDWHPKFDEGYARGVLSTDENELTAVGLWHPSYADWARCQLRLVEDLRSRPLPPGPVNV